MAIEIEAIKAETREIQKSPVTLIIPCKSFFSELMSLLVASNLSEFFLGYSRDEPLQALKYFCDILCIHDFSLWLPDQSLDFDKTLAV